MPDRRCVICDVDLSQARRYRDKTGRYLCMPCLDRAKAVKLAQQQARTGVTAANGGSHAAPRPHHPPQSSASGTNPALSSSGTGPNLDSTINEFLDGDSSLVFELGADTTKTILTRRCPACASPMKDGEILCLACGFNTTSGQTTRGITARRWVWKVPPRLLGFDARSTNRVAILGATIGAGFGVVAWATVAGVVGNTATFMAPIVGVFAGAFTSFLTHRLADRTTGLVAATVTALATIPGKYFAGTFVLGRAGLVGLPAKEWLPYFVSPWDALLCVAAIWIALRLGGRIPRVPVPHRGILADDADATDPPNK